MPKSPKPKSPKAKNQTRKMTHKHLAKHLGDLEYLRNKKEARKRGVSFNESTTTDDDFLKFFNDIGEVVKKSSTKKTKRKTRKKQNI